MKDSRYVYISGAITGRSQSDLELFYQAEAQLNAMGLRAFNALRHPFPEAETTHDGWTRALSRDIATIASPLCLGITVLDTALESKGALLECFVAFSLKRDHILLPTQSLIFKNQVAEAIRRAQAELWANVPVQHYRHHTDLYAQDSPARLLG